MPEKGMSPSLAAKTHQEVIVFILFFCFYKKDTGLNVGSNNISIDVKVDSDEFALRGDKQLA